MKVIHICSLLAAILFFLLPRAAQSQPGRMFYVSEKRDAPRTIVLTVRLGQEDRNAWGASEQGARRNLLQKAQDVLADWLRKQPPFYSFKPTVEFIERELLKKSEGVDGVVVKLEEPIKDRNETFNLYSASANLYLTPEVQDKLRKEADRHVEAQRAHEAWSRQWPLFKGFLLIVTLAAAVGGYFHLDDRTQGYYSNPLRLAAGVVVLAAGYGITLLP